MTDIEKDRVMWGLLANFELALDHSTRCQVANAYKNLIEQHEAFRQEVSDAVKDYVGYVPLDSPSHPITRFIIAKTDPLVDALYEAFPISFDDVPMLPDDISNFYEALAKRGLKIVEDTDAPR